MEILDLRHLRSRDLEPLLEEERALWRSDLEWDYSASAELIKRYVDSAALPGYAAVENSRALGYSFYVQENYKGVIGGVFVLDTPQAEAMERELVTTVSETLQATPGIVRIEAQLMTLRHRPSREFFEKLRLEGFLRQYMVLSIDMAPPVPPTLAGVRVEAWNERWMEDAALLIARAYCGHIDSSISDQYRSPSGAQHFLDNIIRYPGCGDFDPHCSYLAFNQSTGDLCAMALTSMVAPRISHLTQICVSPAVQRRGIGRMLIGRIVQELRKRKAKALTLTVTSSNADAIRLYRHLNFETVREFYAAAWDRPAGESDLGISRAR
jgi:ribosomal protein S18 acetylase RimI-like enzyme